MDDLLKQLQGAGGGAGGAAGGPMGNLGGLLGGGGLGDLLGGLTGGGSAAGEGGGPGGSLGGIPASILAVLPSLLPALLSMLGGKGPDGKSGAQKLVDGMEAQGMGGIASSWVGPGPNEPITPDQAETALGPDRVDQLSAESGLPREQVNQGLAAILPQVMNGLTPNGQMPSADSLQAMLGGLLGR